MPGRSGRGVIYPAFEGERLRPLGDGMALCLASGTAYASLGWRSWEGCGGICKLGVGNAEVSQEPEWELRAWRGNGCTEGFGAEIGETCKTSLRAEMLCDFVNAWGRLRQVSKSTDCKANVS